MNFKRIIPASSCKNLSDYPFYTEGPVMDAEGNLFFTDLVGGSVQKVSNDKKKAVWATMDCPNGQVILSNGDHIVCDSKTACLVRFDKQGRLQERMLNGLCAGESIAVPNDIIEDSSGNIYFTDSIRHVGRVLKIGASGEESIVAKNLDYPNGLALSPNEQTLYVAESYKNRIIAINIPAPQNADGIVLVAVLPQHLSGKNIDNLPDGIKVDAEGNIWVAHYGMGMIHKLCVDGNILRTIKLPFKLVSNLFIMDSKIIVTGGYGEPGPGAIIEFEL